MRVYPDYLVWVYREQAQTEYGAESPLESEVSFKEIGSMSMTAPDTIEVKDFEGGDFLTIRLPVAIAGVPADKSRRRSR